MEKYLLAHKVLFEPKIRTLLYCSASEIRHPSEVRSSPAFYDNIKSFNLLPSYGIYVYLAVERRYSIYLNANIACP